MNDATLLPATDEDARAFRVVASEALLFDAGADWPDGPDREHLVVAKRDGVVVGGYVAWPIAQWFGGRAVPMAGLRAVAVASAHRGRGLADRMMRHALDEAHARGLCIATLYPATQGLYRKQGYEVAGHRVLYEVPLSTIAPSDRPCVVREARAGDRPALLALHGARARAGNGHLERPPWLWDRILDLPYGPKRRAHVLEEGGAITGYVVTSTTKDAHAGRGELLVHDQVVATPAAARALRSFFADHRSMIASVHLQGAPAEPAWSPLEEQAMRVLRWQRFMVRLIDVPAALAARGYAPGLSGELHLDVVDDVRPQNAGRCVLTVEHGRGRVRAGGGGALRVDVRGLASLYASYLTAHELVATGLVTGDDAALDAATALFAGPQPYMTEMF